MPIPYLVSIVCGDSATFFRHNFLFMYVRKQNIWKPAGHQYFIFVFYVIPGQSVFFGQFVLSENISIYMSTIRLAQKTLMPCPSIGTKVLDGYLQIVAVGSKSFWLGPSHFIRFKLDFSWLTFISWTYPKWFLLDQNNLNSPKSF